MQSTENQNQLDDLDDPTYHIHILRMMLNELPPGVRDPILSQFDQLLAAIDQRNQRAVEFWTKVKSHLKEELTTLGVDLKYIQFDLEATKRERDDLKDRLDDLS